MSSEALRALAELFQAAQALNEEAILRLDQGAELSALDDLFKAKTDLLKRLEDFDLAALNASTAASEALLDAQVAQSRGARSETRLAEALSRRRIQKNVNQVTKAYGSKVVDKLGTKGLDLAS